MKKTLVIVIALVAAMTISATAQPRPERAPREQQSATPEEMAERVTERVASQLQLDEKQKSELYKLNLSNAKERRKDAENRRKEAQKREAKSAKQMSKYDADLQKILTAEQYAELKASREKQREQMMERRKGMTNKRGDSPEARGMRSGGPDGKKMGPRDGKPCCEGAAPDGGHKRGEMMERPRKGGERGPGERKHPAESPQRGKTKTEADKRSHDDVSSAEE